MQPAVVVRLLVICSNRENYFERFKDRQDVQVDQAPWLDIRGVVSFSDSCVVHIGPQKEPFRGFGVFDLFVLSSSIPFQNSSGFESFVLPGRCAVAKFRLGRSWT